MGGDAITVTIPAEICDKVRNSSTWQMVLEQPDPTQPDGTYDTPLAVGGFQRFDGLARTAQPGRSASACSGA